MAKQIKYGEDARRALESGVNQLAEMLFWTKSSALRSSQTMA